MKLSSAVFTGVALAMISSASAAILATNAATSSDRIRTFGASSSSDFYAAGNDDTFQSYSIATFTFSAADFGLGTVTDINSVSLNLTFNDRAFSDGTSFEMFFTTDGADYSGLAYEVGSAPSGIDPSDFIAAPVSLGTIALGFDITDGFLGGDNFDYALNFSGAAETALLGEINSGSPFSLIIAAVNDADDITFSGVGNFFDPGDPALTIDVVPEPSGLILLALSGLTLFARRRS